MAIINVAIIVLIALKGIPKKTATIGTDNINGKIDCIEKLKDFAMHMLSAEIPLNLSCDKFPSL